MFYNLPDLELTLHDFTLWILFMLLGDDFFYRILKVKEIFGFMLNINEDSLQCCSVSFVIFQSAIEIPLFGEIFSSKYKLLIV